MTPHISAKDGEIAEKVIMPGDPKRARFIAENYLDDYKLVSDVRGICAYTGLYKNKKVTVMASGMGMPSLGIYVTELFKFYKVKRIIRVGTCGSLVKDVTLNDILVASKTYTDSNFAFSLTGKKVNVAYSSYDLCKSLFDASLELGINIKESVINTSDIFYTEFINKKIKKMKCEAVEMESFALLFLAKHFEREAASLLTVTDNLLSDEHLSSQEREEKLENAIKIALDAI